MKVKMKVQESLIRLFLTLASTVILGTGVVQAAPANLSLIVAASPGTGLDILARTLSQQFAIKGNFTTVVENKAGASGNIAAEQVTRAKPDGATLLVAATSFATNAAVNPNLPFDTVKDFVPVALLGTGTLCLVVPSNSSVNSLAEFLQMAKTSTQGVNYASPGNGTTQHLAMELLKFEANLNLWQSIFDSTEPHRMEFPVPCHEVTPLQRLCVLRCLRRDKIELCMQDFIIGFLGQKFIEPPPFDLKASYNDSAVNIPLIFVLSSGSDPNKELDILADEMNMSDRLKRIALGQGQGKKASQLIEQGIAKGDWVMLQNCHLSISWMPTLEQICESFEPDKINPEFRLWLTSMPSERHRAFVRILAALGPGSLLSHSRL
jgi:hypothetical protein